MLRNIQLFVPRYYHLHNRQDDWKRFFRAVTINAVDLLC